MLFVQSVYFTANEIINKMKQDFGILKFFVRFPKSSSINIMEGNAIKLKSICFFVKLLDYGRVNMKLVYK